MSQYFIFVFLVTIASCAFSLEDESFPYRPRLLYPRCGPYGYIDTGCGSPCMSEPRCSDYQRKDQSQDTVCAAVCVPVCRCNTGFVIDDASGLCVAPKYCKKHHSNKKKGQKETKGKPKEASKTHEA